MPDTDSITLVKSFTYRDHPEEFSNTYHLDGTTPTDQAGWKTVADDLWALERLMMKPYVTLVRAYGYEAGHNHAASVIDYEEPPLTPVAGGGGFTGQRAPGDAAFMVSWWDGQYNSRGRKIYLRKYFHGAHLDPSDTDKITTEQFGAMVLFAGALLDNPISGDLRLVSPQGHSPVNAKASPWVTTRTLKRRGKRPPG